MPLALGELIRVLDGASGRSPWPFLFAYVGFRFLQGSGGLAAIRDVSYYGHYLSDLVFMLILVALGSRDAIF